MEENGIGELESALDEIYDGLEDRVKSGRMDEAEKNHLLDWIKSVLNKLTIKYKRVAKGVEDNMGGKILHTRTDDILDRGRELGREEGLELGREEGLKLGKEEGINSLTGLMKNLLVHGRSEDMQRVVMDAAYRKKLLSEFQEEMEEERHDARVNA